MKIATKLLLHLPWTILFYSNFIWSKKPTWDFSMEDGRFTIVGGITVHTGPFWQNPQVSKPSGGHVDHKRPAYSRSWMTLGNNKARNCELFNELIDYLSNLIKAGCLAASSYRIQAFCTFQTLSNDPELRSFLGLYPVIRRLEPNLRGSCPFQPGIEKYQPSIYTELLDQKCEVLKTVDEILISQSVFALLRNQGKYMVDTNACDQKIGCVLLQKPQDENDKPISYGWYSRAAAELTSDKSD